jgi:hypothetical protein
MTLEYLLIIALSTYRLSLLISKEAGPFDILERFRVWAGVTYDQYSNPVSNGQFSAGILCPFCLSVWIGTCVTLYVGITTYLGIGNIAIYPLLPFALSGFSVFLFKWTGT